MIKSILLYKVYFLRENFAVKSKVDPSNLAYTSLALGLHTDLPYYTNPPGVSIHLYVHHGSYIPQQGNFPRCYYF